MPAPRPSVPTKATSPAGGLRPPAQRTPRIRARLVDVDRHALDQRVDGVEPRLPADALDEGHAHLRPVQVQVVAVEDVRLDASLLAVELGVGAHRDGGRQVVAAVEDTEPARVDAVGRDGGLARPPEVGGRIAQLAPAMVTVDDDAVEAIGAPERGGRGSDVALHDERADRRRRPPLGAVADERRGDRPEAVPVPLRHEGVDGSRRTVAEAEVLAHDDLPHVQPVDQHPVDELLRIHASTSPRRSAGRRRRLPQRPGAARCGAAPWPARWARDAAPRPPPDAGRT